MRSTLQENLLTPFPRERRRQTGELLLLVVCWISSVQACLRQKETSFHALIPRQCYIFFLAACSSYEVVFFNEYCRCCFATCVRSLWCCSLTPWLPWVPVMPCLGACCAAWQSILEIQKRFKLNAFDRIRTLKISGFVLGYPHNFDIDYVLTHFLIFFFDFFV